MKRPWVGGNLHVDAIDRGMRADRALCSAHDGAWTLGTKIYGTVDRLEARGDAGSAGCAPLRLRGARRPSGQDRGSVRGHGNMTRVVGAPGDPVTIGRPCSIIHHQEDDRWRERSRRAGTQASRCHRKPSHSQARRSDRLRRGPARSRFRTPIRRRTRGRRPATPTAVRAPDAPDAPRCVGEALLGGKWAEVVAPRVEEVPDPPGTSVDPMGRKPVQLRSMEITDLSDSPGTVRDAWGVPAWRSCISSTPPIPSRRRNRASRELVKSHHRLRSLTANPVHRDRRRRRGGRDTESVDARWICGVVPPASSSNLGSGGTSMLIPGILLLQGVAQHAGLTTGLLRGCTLNRVASVVRLFWPPGEDESGR